MIFFTQQPDFLKEYKYGLFDLPRFVADPMITSGMDNFIEMLDKVPNLKKYKPHFVKIKQNYLKRLQCELQEYQKNRRSDAYYVLCHGDFHLRNMMFKKDLKTGALEDVMLVDFQISSLSPISTDLIYSIYMLMEPEQRREMGKELINYYFSVLLATLQKIGYKGTMPTQAKLWEQIHRNKYYGELGKRKF